MAKKRRSSRRWLRALVLFVAVPVGVWILAFLIWFFWYDIGNFAGRPASQPKAAPKAPRKSDEFKPQTRKPAREDIPNEDRKRLEEIIDKRR